MDEDVNGRIKERKKEKRRKDERLKKRKKEKKERNNITKRHVVNSDVRKEGFFMRLPPFLS